MHGRNVAIAVCVIYILIVMVLCYYLPFSKLFRNVHRFDDLLNQVETATELRSENAKRYFKNLNPVESSTFYNSRLGKNLTFVLGIVTVQRLRESKTHESYGYLLQSAASIDTIFKENPYFNKSIAFICNVDDFPKKHMDAVNLYKFIHYAERYGQNSMNISRVSIPSLDFSFEKKMLYVSKYHKETFDYAFCLAAAAALSPQYIILVEDDTMVHADFPSVLENLLQTRLNPTYQHPHNSKFAFLKLYFPAKWQGFGFEISKLLDLLSLSVVGGLLFSLICLCWPVNLRHQSTIKHRYFIIGCLTTLISCWLIGRQNINELRRISKYFYRLQSSEGCCTQAMLYPIYVTDSLSRYLISNVTSKHTDLAVLDFSVVSGLLSYQVEPSLFYHVGLHTTLDLEQKHPEEFILHHV